MKGVGTLFSQPLHSQFLMICVAVVGKRIDADTATRHEIAFYLDILRIHRLNKVFHDDVDTVLMKIAVITEGEEIKLQRFTLHHAFAGDIGDVDVTKIRLPRHRTQRSELGTVKCNEILVVRMFVDKRFNQRRIIVR